MATTVELNLLSFFLAVWGTLICENCVDPSLLITLILVEMPHYSTPDKLRNSSF